MKYKKVLKNADNNYKHNPKELDKIVKDVVGDSTLQQIMIELSKK